MFDQLPRERLGATVEAGVYAHHIRVGVKLHASFRPYNVERTLHPACHVLDPDSTAYWNARFFGPLSYLRLNQQVVYSFTIASTASARKESTLLA